MLKKASNIYKVSLAKEWARPRRMHDLTEYLQTNTVVTIINMLFYLHLRYASLQMCKTIANIKFSRIVEEIQLKLSFADMQNNAVKIKRSHMSGGI